jgi:hypothetical protein
VLVIDKLTVMRCHFLGGSDAGSSWDFYF